MIISIEAEQLLRWLDTFVIRYGQQRGEPMLSEPAIYLPHQRYPVAKGGIYFTGDDYHVVDVYHEVLNPPPNTISVLNLERKLIANRWQIERGLVTTRPQLATFSIPMVVGVLNHLQYENNTKYREFIHRDPLRKNSEPLMQMDGDYLEDVIEFYVGRHEVSRVLDTIIDFYDKYLREFFMLFKDKLIEYDFSRDIVLIKAEHTPMEKRYIETLGEHGV